MSFKNLVLVGLCTTILSVQADPSQLSQALRNHPIQGISQDTLKQIEAIKKRHGGSFVRPEACPLASKNYGDILSKIESIRGLFKDPSCLSDETALGQTYNDLVTTTAGVQEQLSTAGLNSTPVNGEETQVSGASINSIFSNLNTLFFQNSCELVDKNVLEKGADFAQNFAQMGLLIPNSNGIYITGGGLALSGILRLINNLFTKKFNFENNSERQAFIKLNCAFYDIRRDIEKSGMVEIALPEHREDLGELKEILEGIKKTSEANTKAQAKQLEIIKKAEDEFVSKKSESLAALEKSTTKAKDLIDEKVADQDNGKKPAETVKREMLTGLISIKETLLIDLKNYFELGLSPATILDMDLQQELAKLDLTASPEAFMTLYKMPADAFNNTYRASLLFHFDRVLKDITKLKSEVRTKWRAETEIAGKKVGDYIKSVEKEIEESKKSLSAASKSLDPINARLERIVGGDSGYTRTDDGTENKTAILSSYDEIANQVYGKWGYEFLKYTTKTAEKENDAFSSKFEDFARNHLGVENRTYVVKDQEKMDELRVLYACQDAKPYLRRYAGADSLVQQAYDFVVTNKELFHSDHSDPFLSDITRIRSVFEKIQDHHKSSIYALKIMRGEKVPPSAKESYLGKKAYRKEFLGTVMLKVNETKPKAQLLQNLMDKYDCNRLTNIDD
jgi:hypothetical protein